MYEKKGFRLRFPTKRHAPAVLSTSQKKQCRIDINQENNVFRE